MRRCAILLLLALALTACATGPRQQFRWAHATKPETQLTPDRYDCGVMADQLIAHRMTVVRSPGAYAGTYGGGMSVVMLGPEAHKPALIQECLEQKHGWRLEPIPSP